MHIGKITVDAYTLMHSELHSEHSELLLMAKILEFFNSLNMILSERQL